MSEFEMPTYQLDEVEGVRSGSESKNLYAGMLHVSYPVPRNVDRGFSSSRDVLDRGDDKTTFSVLTLQLF